MAFRSYQANVECLPIDHDGLDTEALERRLAARRIPKLLYTTPDHQNPAGLSLSADRRRVLVELARRHGFLLVEDVAYRELGFAGERLASLWSLAPDIVLQVGTFSKTFFPGVPFFPDGRGRNNLRLAFSRIDDEVIPEGVRRLAALVRRAVREPSRDDRR